MSVISLSAMPSSHLRSLPAIGSANKTKQTVGKVLLIDDDPSYRSLFRATCKGMGLCSQAYKSFTKIPSFEKLKDFDLVVLDYYLDSHTGQDIAEYIDIFFPDLPVVLISSDENLHLNLSNYYSIKKIFCKSVSLRKILKSSILMADRINHYKDLARR